MTDKASGQTRVVRFPGDIAMLNQIPLPWARELQGYAMYWSRDGEQVLAYFRVDGKKGRAEDYYRVRLADGKPERIDGRHDLGRSRPVFLDGASRIPVDDRFPPPLRSDQTYPALRSPDGTTRELYRAGRDPCHAAYVIAWLDSRYVLYRNYRWSTYVGDARTGRSKNLFPDFKGPELFDW